MAQLYATHIPTTLIQKGFLAFGSAFAAFINPERADMVAAMGETTAFLPILKNIRARMESDVCGKRILSERPRVTSSSVNLDRLKLLPKGTLGKEYTLFLDGLSTTPEQRPAVRFVDDDDLAYIMQRYREIHDFTHVILQMKTTVLGEITVKYFEGLQLGLPMCLLGSVFGSLMLDHSDRRALVEHYLPWSMEQAVKSRLFIAFDWENHFDESVSDLQKACSVTPFPG